MTKWKLGLGIFWGWKQYWNAAHSQNTDLWPQTLSTEACEGWETSWVFNQTAKAAKQLQASCHQPSQVWALLWGVEQSRKRQPCAGIEAPAAHSLTKCQVLCLSQSLIWAITFCLHTFHSSFPWRHFNHGSYLQSHKAPPNTLLRFWCPTEGKASPLPSGVSALLPPVVLSSLMDVSKKQSFFHSNRQVSTVWQASKPLWELLRCFPGH